MFELSKWARLWIRILHRDIGYFLAPLVILYSISGIAVNHIDDWNPSYATEVRKLAMGRLAPAGQDPFEVHGLDGLQALLTSQLALDPAEVQGRRRSSPKHFMLFLPEGGEAKVDVTTGAGTLKRVTPRPLLFEANVLHLNHLKGAWTWAADIMGLLLLFLAVSGLVMLKGKKGFWGRGKWFFAAGCLVPAVFLAYYSATR